jgi:hypothetical protein
MTAGLGTKPLGCTFSLVCVLQGDCCPLALACGQYTLASPAPLASPERGSHKAQGGFVVQFGFVVQEISFLFSLSI